MFMFRVNRTYTAFFFHIVLNVIKWNIYTIWSCVKFIADLISYHTPFIFQENYL